jgi:hypothetical protein
VDNFVKNLCCNAPKPRLYWLRDGLMTLQAQKTLYKSMACTCSGALRELWRGPKSVEAVLWSNQAACAVVLPWKAA